MTAPKPDVAKRKPKPKPNKVCAGVPCRYAVGERDCWGWGVMQPRRPSGCERRFQKPVAV